MSSGALVELIGKGAQDANMIGNPQITFFKVVFRRYTNFATENIEQVFTGTTDFNRRVTCTISRNGDLITKVYLRVILPGANMAKTPGNKWAWVANVGNALISSYSIEIGGTTIDKQYGKWLDVWHELTKNVGLENAYNNLIGNIDDLTSFKYSHKPATVWVPFQFYFNRNNGLAIPLIALQYHEVKINVEFSTLASLVSYEAGLDLSSFTSVMSMVSASLFVDYVYLDNEERKRFAQAQHEYLIEQLQYSGPESINSSNNKFKINFNHPCKALFFQVQLGKWNNGSSYLYYDYTNSSSLFDLIHIRDFATKRVLLALMNQDPYTGSYIPPPNSPSQLISVSGFSGIDYLYGINTTFTSDSSNNYITSGPYASLFNRIKGLIYSVNTPQIPYVNYLGDSLTLEEISNPVNNLILYNTAEHNVKDVVAFVRPNGSSPYNVTYYYGLASAPAGVSSVPNALKYSDGAPQLDRVLRLPTNYGLLLDGSVDPMGKIGIQLNGHDRLSVREAFYFKYVQPYQCFSSSGPASGCVYSFAINPEDHQPSGCCNFSRIDNATIQIQCENSIINDNGYQWPVGNVYNGSDSTWFFLYAINYNVLRVMSGMAGTQFSS